MGQKAKTEFRIVGGDGAWIAYHQWRTPKWGPHQMMWYVPKNRHTGRTVTAVRGRSPSEALHRLQRQLVAA